MTAVSRSLRWSVAVGGVFLMLAPLTHGQVKFQDQTAALAPNFAGSQWGAWGDYNNDGYADLLTETALWRNDQGRGFKSTGVDVDGGIIGDYDNDGHRDIFSIYRRKLYRNSGDGRFVQTALPGLPMNRSQGSSWADHDNDGDLDLYVGGYESPYQPDAILRNDGAAGFTKRWQQSGDIDPARGVTSADYDNDGDADIYVSNYRLEANLLLENNGTGQFANVAKARGVAGDYDGWSYSYGHTIGSAWGDLDNDGLHDLFVGNFSHSDARQDRPKFYKNLGPERGFAFEDKTATARLAWQESYASPALADYDNDGDLDLYFTTVYSGDHPVLYRNDGNWRFTNVTAEAGLANLGSTYQAAWADYDQDGDLDLLTNGRIFVNQGNDNHWLRVVLQGDGERVNLDAIGAQVRIQLEDQTLLREVTAGTGRGNQSELTLHFGLGAYDQPVDLEILWPGGMRQTISGVAPDQTLNVVIPEPASVVSLVAGCIMYMTRRRGRSCPLSK